MAAVVSTRDWSLKLQQAQDGANEAARLEFAQDYTAAFAAYIHTGETYLWLLRNLDKRPKLIGSSSSSSAAADDPDTLKARLRRAAGKVLERAELIKSRRREVVPPVRDPVDPGVQHVVLSKSSRVGERSYPLWEELPPQYTSSDHITSTHEQPELAPAHLDRLASFRPASQIKGSPCFIDHKAPLRGQDIVQDAVSDCSLVAALQVAAEYDSRWASKIATAAMHPRDGADRAAASKDGIYHVKLWFNGGARRVVIDDMLPCFPNGELIGASSNQGDQYWPALVEKAFLKVVIGGYNFPGSNSAADLYTLTGWLPDQVLLQQAGFRREQIWRSLHTAYTQGRCILTVGTGADADRHDSDRRWAWLSPAHNYAVLDLREEDGHRQVTVVNSWRQATTGHRQIHVLSWEDVCGHFDALHVNWRVSDFAYRESAHCSWSSRHERVDLSQNTQLQIIIHRGQQGAGAKDMTEAEDSLELWLHLNRHMSPNKENARVLIALHAFNHTEGRKFYRLTDHEQMGAFTDSDHVLRKIQVGPECKALTVIASRFGPDVESAFSLSVYASVPVTIQALPRAYPYHITTTGSWTGRSAGGNLSQPTFGFNPQYQLQIGKGATADTLKASILIMAETTRTIPLQIMLVHSDGGKRIHQVEESDVIMSSGAYTHAVAMAEQRANAASQDIASALAASTLTSQLSGGVAPGTYTLIVSAFAPGVEGDFLLSVESSLPVAQLRPIPPEGAGQFHRSLNARWSLKEQTAGGGPTSGTYYLNPTWRLVVPPGGATIQMRLRLDTEEIRNRPSSSRTRPSSPLPTGRRPSMNIAIFKTHDMTALRASEQDRRYSAEQEASSAKVRVSPTRELSLKTSSEVASSGPYADHLHGVTTGQRRLEAGEYIFAASTYAPGQEAAFVIHLWSDVGLDVIDPH
ncbi:cysteine protease [Tilletia horrida]|uniref:Cysteine protease n=1 Tax=Tilletia horrida TaxID=155126 RepID=A0AAN6GNK3_9BASI|nr:cysteine protease [Tilletia horrida]KAK0543258.1 cysteine protease [Tilletia horrida]KAK0559712.1 cysteine protease [Tilletia horrida]